MWLESGTGTGSGSLVESDGIVLVRNRTGLSCHGSPAFRGPALKALLSSSRLTQAMVGSGPWDNWPSVSYL